MEKITLKNFRCFREEQTVRLTPLTLLVGENSTGKTSFMALIRALLLAAFQHDVPDFKKEPYDLGSFDEIAHNRGGRGSRASTFEVGFEFTPRHPIKGMDVATGSCRFEVDFGKKGTVPFPVRTRLSKKDHWIEYNLQKDGSWSLCFGIANSRWQIKSSELRTMFNDDHWFSYLRFVDWVLLKQLDLIRREDKENYTKLVIPLDGNDPPTQEGMDLIVDVSISTFHQSAALYASAPIRSKPHRTYDPSRTVLDPEGDYVPMYLANVYFQKNKKMWSTLKEEIERFGKAAGLFDEITIKPLGKRDSEPFQVQVRKFDGRLKGPPRNLIDVGYGVSQVLPVITELLRQDAPPMFLLQQPEVHLHPSAQAALGSLFCRVAGLERQLVIETHSDYLLDRVRMDIRDGTTKLKPEDVSILFFERSEMDVNIHSLHLDEEGNVLDAPPGYSKFFMEETQRSLGL